MCDSEGSVQWQRLVVEVMLLTVVVVAAVYLKSGTQVKAKMAATDGSIWG